MRIRHFAFVIVALAVASVALAGPAMKGNLHGTNGAQGFVKVKFDREGALQLFEVQIRKVPAATYYVYVFSQALEDDGDLSTDPWVEVGSIDLSGGQGAGKFKVNTSRGDLDPIGFDPKGADIEVRNSNDSVTYDVVLDGEIPAEKVKGPK